MLISIFARRSLTRWILTIISINTSLLISNFLGSRRDIRMYSVIEYLVLLRLLIVKGISIDLISTLEIYFLRNFLLSKVIE